jgi:NAD-dependent deacetylase
MSGPYERAAGLVAGSKRAVGFTGAGISAESGIPTFRDPGGVWDKFSLSNMIMRPHKIRQNLLEAVDTLEAAEVNPAHVALKDLEDMGIIKAVITQNIDELHNMAGSTNVIEVHGNLYRSRCKSCGRREKLTRDQALARIRSRLQERFLNPIRLIRAYPRCRCGGKTRPDVVNFGEPVQDLPEAFQASVSCDLMIILGTSGKVYPCARLPYEARKRNAKIIEINPTENAFSDITDVFIMAKAGEGMAMLVEETRKMIA